MDSGGGGLLIQNACLGDKHLLPALRKRTFFRELAREAQENSVMATLRGIKTMIKVCQFGIF